VLDVVVRNAQPGHVYAFGSTPLGETREDGDVECPRSSITQRRELYLQGEREGAVIDREKGLKALVARKTREVPARTHDLLRLANLAGVVPDGTQAEVPALSARYCLEGRYPESWPAAPGRTEAQEIMKRMEETLAWLLKA